VSTREAWHLGPDGEPRPAYELTLAAVALVFLLAYAWPILQPGLPPVVRHASRVVIVVTWAVFVVDYVVRLHAATDRPRWFSRHLLDLLVLALPVLRPLPLLRLVVVVRVLNRSVAATLRGRVGIYLAGGSVLVSGVAALAVLDAERDAPGALITSYGDALWWAATTVTTVGYGDLYPVTVTGRLVAVGLMIAGIGLLGTVTAGIASWLVQNVGDRASAAVGEVVEGSAEDRDEVARELAALRAEVAALRAARPEDGPG